MREEAEHRPLDLDPRIDPPVVILTVTSVVSLAGLSINGWCQSQRIIPLGLALPGIRHSCSPVFT